MEKLYPLPAREVPMPGESLASLLRRTSAAMGYEGVFRIRSLLSKAGKVPLNLNRLASGPMMDRLACWLGCSPEDLIPLTVHGLAESLVLVPRDADPTSVCDSKTVLRFLTATSPVCPHCLHDDRVAYERLLWSFRPTQVCLRHACTLVVACSACHRDVRPNRDETLHCSCGRDLREETTCSVSTEAHQLFERFQQWLGGRVLFLPGMTPAASFALAERLAAAIKKTPSWMQTVAARLRCEDWDAPDAVAWLAAADIVGNWPTRLEQFLEYYQTVPKHHRTSTGLERSFGVLLRDARSLEEHKYPLLADALRDYLLKRYTGGHVKGVPLLFKSPGHRELLSQREWMTQTAADKFLGLRVGAVAHLVQRGVLPGALHCAGSSGRLYCVVAREAVISLKGELKDALDGKQTAKRLGIGPRRVAPLIRARLLPVAVRTQRGWVVARSSVVQLESLYQGLSPIKRGEPAWLSFREATRVFGPGGLTLVKILELIKANRLPARRLATQENFQGLYVSKSGLEALMPEVSLQRFQKRGYPLHALARVLFPERPIKAYVLRRWVKLGILRIVRRGRALIISPQEVERFRSTYCLAGQACQLLGIGLSTFRKWETEGWTKPVYGPRVTPNAGFSLYRREDLLQLQAQRADVPRRRRRA